MTAVKERIIGAVSIMSDKDADIFWHIIQKHFTAPDLFANIEEVEPDEISAFHAYQSGDPEYQPSYSQDDLIKELGL